VAFPQAVLFDLLTALLDSWSLWNAVAGSAARGRDWRMRYLRMTYGCGDYLPYAELVRASARAAGLPDGAADALEARWPELAPWSGAAEALAALAGKTRLAVVSNCSRRLGERAAQRLGVRWDCVITAEEAGAYKPDPRPYRLALDRLGVNAEAAAFVAGSGYDLYGTAALGLPAYWHNRLGLAPPEGAPRAALESPTLDALPAWLEAARRQPRSAIDSPP
jgi:2-haloalkanoic acid dehalogenase type II